LEAARRAFGGGGCGLAEQSPSAGCGAGGRKRDPPVGLENRGADRIVAEIGSATFRMRYQAIVDGAEHELDVEELDPHTMRVKLGDKTFDVDLRQTHGRSYLAMVGDRAFDFSISSDGDDLVMTSRRGVNRVTLIDRSRRRLQPTGERLGDDRFVAAPSKLVGTHLGELEGLPPSNQALVRETAALLIDVLQIDLNTQF